MGRGIALAPAVALAVSLLAVSSAGGSDAQTPKRGGTLVIGTQTQGEPAVFERVPLKVQRAVRWWSRSFRAPSRSGRTRPCGATSSRTQRSSGQPVTIVYRIRQEARWSDGVPVTARDFEFTHEVPLEHPRVNEWHLDVRCVRAVGAKTVEVVLGSRWVDWRLLFDHVLPRHVAAGQDFESLWRTRSITRGRDGRSAAGHPSLWAAARQAADAGQESALLGAAPCLPRSSRVRFVPPQDMADLLRRGEIDMIDTASPVMEAQARERHRQRAPGIRVDSVLGASWEHFAIRHGLRPPRAPEAPRRQAIAYGIDRAVIAREAAALDLASAAASKPLDRVVPLAQNPYHERNWSAYRHRPARAGSCSNGRAAAAEPTASTSATATAFRSASRRLRAYRDGSTRSGSRRLSCGRWGSRSSLSSGRPQRSATRRTVSWCEGTSTSSSSRGSTGRSTQGPANIFGCQQPRNYTGYCDRLVTRDLVNATQTLDDARARRSPEQGRREAGEGRAGYPALSDYVP